MFPEWIKEAQDGSYQIDADIAYPALLNELKDSIASLPEPDATELPWLQELRSLDPENPTQYWVEVVYQMAKLDVQRYLMLNGKPHWGIKRNVVGNKTKWGHSNLPVGRGPEAATTGKEAREHYRRLRGFIPN